MEIQGNEIDKKGKIPFGAMAVRLGYATPEQVLQVLEEQRLRKSRGKKHILLGLLMIKLGIITTGQMRQVMKNFNEMEALSSDDAIHLAVRIRSAFSEPNKIILFTSAVEHEGVSLLVSQISSALALMEQGKVLLVDANFRSPTLHARIRDQIKQPDAGFQNLAGLSDLIEKKADLESAIYPSDYPNLSLLPTGNTAVDFLSLLLSEECAELMDTFRQRYALVLIDSAPMLLYPDSTLLSPRTDGVVLVLSAGSRRKAEVLEMKRSLEGLKVPIIGTVLCHP